MEKPASIRLADQNDIEPLFWALMQSYLEDDTWLGVSVSDKSVYETVRDICSGNGGIAGVIDGPHGVIGSMALKAVQPWFSSQHMLTEVWFFVSAPYRKGSNFSQDLFHFAEWHRQDMSERLGYDMVLENAVMGLHRLPAKLRLWQQFYGPPIGGVFWTRGKSDVLQQQFEQDQYEPADESCGPVGLYEPAGTGAEHGEQAAPALSRPNGRAAEFDAERGDQRHLQRPKPGTAVFD